jgi:hypothetical protein
MSRSMSASALPPERSPYHDFCGGLFIGASVLATITTLAIGGILLANMHSLNHQFFTQSSSLLLGGTDLVFILTAAISGYHYFKLRKQEKERLQLIETESQGSQTTGEGVADEALEEPLGLDDTPPATPKGPKPPSRRQSHSAAPPPLAVRVEALPPQSPAPPAENVPGASMGVPVASAATSAGSVGAGAAASVAQPSKHLTKEEVQKLAAELLGSMEHMFVTLITSEGSVDKCDVRGNLAALKQAFAGLKKHTTEMLTDPAYVLMASLMPKYKSNDAQMVKWVKDCTVSGWTGDSVDGPKLLKKIATDLSVLFPDADDAKAIFEALKQLPDNKLRELAARGDIAYALEGLRDRTKLPWKNGEVGAWEGSVGSMAQLTPRYLVDPGAPPVKTAKMSQEYFNHVMAVYKAKKDHYESRELILQRNHLETIVMALVKVLPEERSKGLSDSIIGKTLPLLSEQVFRHIVSIPKSMSYGLTLVSKGLSELQKSEGVKTIRDVVNNRMSALVTILNLVPVSEVGTAAKFIASTSLPGFLRDKAGVIRQIAADLITGLYMPIWRTTLQEDSSQTQFQRNLFAMMTSDNNLSDKLLGIEADLTKACDLTGKVQVLRERFCKLLNDTFTLLGQPSAKRSAPAAAAVAK